MIQTTNNYQKPTTSNQATINPQLSTKMDKNKAFFELIWWLITAVTIGLVMLPIFKNFPEFPFLIANIVYIAVFVTATRYTFLLKYTFLGQVQVVKIALVLLCIALVSLLLYKMQDFQVWAATEDPNRLLYQVKANKREALFSYIKAEYLFFAIGSIVAQIFLTFRLLQSIWNLRNRGIV